MRHRDAARSQSAIGRKTVRTIWALPLLAAGAACAGLLLTTTSSLAVGRLEPSAPLVSPLTKRRLIRAKNSRHAAPPDSLHHDTVADAARAKLTKLDGRVRPTS